MSKTAVIVMSDPKNGGDEALGRLFNALVTAYDIKQRGDKVAVLFHGTGTRWSGLVTDPAHPLNALYEAVKDKVAGASSGCADFFGATQAAKDNGFKLLSETLVPGTSGLPSIAGRLADGHRIVTF